MKTLFDLVDDPKEEEAVTSSKIFTEVNDETVKSWAKDRKLSHTLRKTPVGSAAIINSKLALIINPTSSSSQELRDQQALLKKEAIDLYYVYPWEKDSHKLYSHFESKLGLDTRKYAAKRLLVEEISNDDGNKFMKAYHIQGAASGAGKVSIALKTKDNKEILAVQQFSRYRFGTKKGAGTIMESPVWEGLRLCFKPGVQIYGGASRLQKYFEQKYKPEKIISYINLSHSDGRYKAHQGFTDVTDWNQLSYMWVLEGEPKIVPIIDKDGIRRENNLEDCRKNKYLNPSRMAGAFGRGIGQTVYGGKLGSRAQLREHPENGELVHNDRIMEEIGWKKHYTSGQAKWVKEYDWEE